MGTITTSTRRAYGFHAACPIQLKRHIEREDTMLYCSHSTKDPEHERSDISDVSADE